jgi:hypothetical protein
VRKLTDDSPMDGHDSRVMADFSKSQQSNQELCGFSELPIAVVSGIKHSGPARFFFFDPFLWWKALGKLHKLYLGRA